VQPLKLDFKDWNAAGAFREEISDSGLSVSTVPNDALRGELTLPPHSVTVFH
jgi:hypothetical protein